MIILGGPARSGKTTIANLIAENAFDKGLRPHLVSFASPIKEIAKKKGLTKESNPNKYRKFCQELGATKREEDSQHWIKEFDKVIDSLKKEEKIRHDLKMTFWETIVIVDDCRYMNEVAYGRENNAILIFVHPGDRSLEGQSEDWRQHESEALADRVMHNKDYKEVFPWMIRNEESLEDLKSKVDLLNEYWCDITADNILDNCDCELCVARREDRSPDILKLIEALIEKLEAEIEDEET